MTLSAPITTSCELDSAVADADTVAAVTITYGRQSTLEQPQPATCTVTMLADAATQPELGMPLTITSSQGATDWQRFTGNVVGIERNRYTIAVTCTSAALGRLARLNGPDYTFTNQLVGAGANLDALLYASGATKGVNALAFTYDAGTTTIVPSHVVPAGNVLAQCQAIAGYDVSGWFWEQQDGTLRFSDSTARPFTNTSGADVFLAVSAAAFLPVGIADSWRAVQNLDGLVNQASITYGRPSATVVMAEDDSITTWGLFAYSEDLPVVDADDAVRRASRLIANGNQPRVQTNPITVALEALNDSQAAGILNADMLTSFGWLPSASASGIPGLPEYCFLEGYTERITGHGAGSLGSHRLDLWLSDVALTRSMQQWDQVTPTLTWATVTAGTQWFELAGENI